MDRVLRKLPEPARTPARARRLAARRVFSSSLLERDPARGAAPLLGVGWPLAGAAVLEDRGDEAGARVVADGSTQLK
eukprot:6558974-Lingulodinium_polyedra.AAC.1